MSECGFVQPAAQNVQVLPKVQHLSEPVNFRLG